MQPDRTALEVFCKEYELRTVGRMFSEYLEATSASAASVEQSLFDSEDAAAQSNFEAAELTAADLEQLRDAEEMAVSTVFSGTPPFLQMDLLALSYGEEQRIVRADSAQFEAVRAILAKRPVVLWNAKRYAQAGLTIGANIFDLELADYLLRPEESKRDIERAAFARLGSLPEASEGLTDEQRAVREVLLAAQLSHPMQEALATAGLSNLYRKVELPLVPVLAEMERTGIYVNRTALERERTAANARIDALAEEIHALAGADFNISSPKQLGEILFERLDLAAGSKIKKTKTGYSTNAETLEELKDRHPIVSKVLTYRMWTKLRSTYLEGIGALIRPATGRVHTSFNQTVTATGRLSSSDPNLQNIPVRTEEGRAVRALFEPGEGYDVLLSADYSQIELRILAHMSGDATLIDAFRSGQDIHARTASEVFGVPIDSVTSEQRRRAKAVNFGIVYGLSDFGLARDLGISRKEAAGYIERYFERYHGVREFLDKTIADAHTNGSVTTLYGRRRDLPAINSRNFMQRSFAERMAMNTPIQGTAADLIKIAMIRADEALRAADVRSRILLQVHDELVLEVVADEIAQVSDILCTAMSGAAELAVPLAVDVHTGKNWAEAK